MNMTVACSFQYACNMRCYAVTLSSHMHGYITKIGGECMNKLYRRVVQQIISDEMLCSDIIIAYARVHHENRG